MNMYSQYTPQPVGLPLLLPVPLVLPVNTDGSESTVKSTKESLRPENLQGELNIRPETETEQSEEGQKHGQMIKEEEGHKPSSLQDHASSCSSDLRTDFKPTFDNQQDFFDTSAGPVTQPPGRQTSPPVSDEDMPSSPLPHLPPLSPPSALETPQRSPVAPPPPILVPQTLDKDKNKDCNLEQLSKKDEQDTPETDFTQLVSSKQNTLKTSLRQRSDLFYLQPDRSCLPSSPLWFSPAPLNDSSVEATIIRILAVRGLEEGAREGTCITP
ncbi:calpain-5 [Sarotherodon galilaeus]